MIQAQDVHRALAIPAIKIRTCRAARHIRHVALRYRRVDRQRRREDLS